MTDSTDKTQLDRIERKLDVLFQQVNNVAVLAGVGTAILQDDEATTVDVLNMADAISPEGRARSKALRKAKKIDPAHAAELDISTEGGE